MSVSLDFINTQKELWDNFLGRCGPSRDEIDQDNKRYEQMMLEYPLVNEPTGHHYQTIINAYNPVRRNEKFLANNMLKIAPEAQCLLQGLFGEFTHFIEKYYHCCGHRPYTVFLVYFFAKMCMIDMDYEELLRHTKALPSHHLMFFRLKRYIFFFLCEFITDRLFHGVQKFITNGLKKNKVRYPSEFSPRNHFVFAALMFHGIYEDVLPHELDNSLLHKSNDKVNRKARCAKF